MDKENILSNFQSKAKNAAPIGGVIKFEIDGNSICIDGTGSENKILLEVNLFNFNRNLYNKKLGVEFIKFIRREKKFKSIKQLTNQIKKDIRVAKNSLK